MPLTRPQGPTAPRAFLAWENRRRGRYELVGGEIRAMAGGTRAHDLVYGNRVTRTNKAGTRPSTN